MIRGETGGVTKIGECTERKKKKEAVEGTEELQRGMSCSKKKEGRNRREKKKEERKEMRSLQGMGKKEKEGIVTFAHARGGMKGQGKGKKTFHRIKNVKGRESPGHHGEKV